MRQNKAKTVKTPSELSNLKNIKIQKSPKSDSQIGDFYPDDVDQNSYNPMYVRKYIYVKYLSCLKLFCFLVFLFSIILINFPADCLFNGKTFLFFFVELYCIFCINCTLYYFNIKAINFVFYFTTEFLHCCFSLNFCNSSLLFSFLFFLL